MKKILIVEDDLRLWDKWLSDMSENYELVFAGTREEAEVAFADNNDISLIAMDGYLTLDLRQNDGRDLVIKFRRTFTGPMIVGSRGAHGGGVRVRDHGEGRPGEQGRRDSRPVVFWV